MSISSGDSKSASFEDFLRILPDLEMSILIFGFGLFSNVFLSFVYVWIRRLKCYQTVIFYSRIYTRFLHILIIINAICGSDDRILLKTPTTNFAHLLIYDVV